MCILRMCERNIKKKERKEYKQKNNFEYSRVIANVLFLHAFNP